MKTDKQQWHKVFGVLYGHRFVWWASEREFDLREPPLDGILFSGHSGLAGVSPLVLSEIGPQEQHLVVSVFGRGQTGQQKVNLLVPTAESKVLFEDAVIDACSDAKIA